MNLLTSLFAAAQDSSESESLLSRLLGIDRINPDAGPISLSWRHELPLWVIVLVIIPAIIGLVWLIYRRERSDVPAAARWILAGLRSAILLLVFAMLMGPMLTLEIVKFKRAFLLVLVDDSLSMRRSDPPTRLEDQLALAQVTDLWNKNEPLPDAVRAELMKLSRADLVRKALENPRLGVLSKLEEKLNVAYLTFSKGVRSVENRQKLLSDYRNENIIGTETAIGEAIKQARAMYKGLHVAGIVVISDGRNNLGIDPVTVAKDLRQQWVPVFTVAAGIPQRMKDIAFTDPEAKQVVRANNRHQLKWTVRSEGFDGEDIDVSLHVYPLKAEDYSKDWAALDPQELERILADSTTKVEGNHRYKVREGSERNRDEFLWEPVTPGEYLVIARTPPREGERSATNNHVAQRVKVVDDKVRVLYVDHPPRWEYRYLKNALIRDPKVLVHCFLTSADEGFPQEHSLEATDEKFKVPLREFPKTIEELLVYDVIILGDVAPSHLGGSEALANIKRFVTEWSGGLVFISGLMYNPRSFRGTALEELLPVIPEEARESETYQQVYKYALTDYAKADGGHPIIRFPSVTELPAVIEKWEDLDNREDDLPGIRWFTKARPKPTAQTLVEIVGVQGQDIPGKRPPLFVAANTGRGRIFWSATDETHVWRFLVGDQPWFYPFWQQVMYWAMDRKLTGAQRYQLYLHRHDRRYVMGDTVLMSANAYSRDFQPLQDPELEVNVEPPQGPRYTFKLSKSQDKDGFYEGALQPREVGPYRIWAGDDDETSRAVEKFLVYIPNREEDEPILDTALLRSVAREGFIGEAAKPEEREKNFFSITRIGELPAAVQESKQQQSERKDDDLWDSPLVYLVFAILITSEWVLRKVFRML
ncbi:MAG TPA: hypothetical protein VK661_04255 [Planctomycetota bacterium]|nr:hypothetical protein [Planctomycetota bacterium]